MQKDSKLEEVVLLLKYHKGKMLLQAWPKQIQDKELQVG
jgi:hypothetical protein